MVISCISRIPYLALKKLEKTYCLYSGFYGKLSVLTTEVAENTPYRHHR